MGGTGVRRPSSAILDRMNWRSLVRRLNPAACERVKCDLCDGTGFELVGEKIRYRRRSPVHCEKCHGRGWHLVEREPG